MFWSDDKELLSGADTIGWNSLKKIKIKKKKKKKKKEEEEEVFRTLAYIRFWMPLLLKCTFHGL